MQSISHGTPGGGEIVIRFEGDLFEMEDQRNWTDASYKTYSTPLRIAVSGAGRGRATGSGSR